MVASTDIKFYVHTNTNAPQLTNNFGCMINVLDACLVNGFGSQTVSTLTASGTTVTATYGSAHNFMQYQVIEIAGATQTEYNGEHRILTVPDANTLTFELAAVPSVTTATGTITCKLPSLNWEKPFSATGKAAYRSKNTLLSARPYLRVVDALDPAYTATYAKYAKVGIVEDMTDIDTMLGVQAPYNASFPDRNWVGSGSGATAINGWAKWYYARSSNAHSSSGSDASNPPNDNRSWILIGNSDYFYILPSQVGGGSAFAYGFGAFRSLLNVDTSNTFLSAVCEYAAANGNYAYFYNSIGRSDVSSNILILQRGYAQTANYKMSNCISLQAFNSSVIYSGTTNYIGAYSLNNIAPFAPAFINEDVLRGELPNIYYLFQVRPYSNYALIEKNNSIYIAVNVCAGQADNVGQIVLKVGDL